MRVLAKTICSLRRVCCALAEYFAPSSQQVWRQLVIWHHNFDSSDSDFERRFSAWLYDVTNDPERHPFPDAGAATKSLHLLSWKATGVAFRPSQYGFLEDIQTGKRSIDTWPVTEDAFTLYKDLFELIVVFGPLSGKIHRTNEENHPDSSFTAAPLLINAEDGADVGYCVGHHLVRDTVARNRHGEVTDRRLCDVWDVDLFDPPVHRNYGFWDMVQCATSASDGTNMVSTASAHLSKSRCMHGVSAAASEDVDVPVYYLSWRKDHEPRHRQHYLGLVGYIANAWDFCAASTSPCRCHVGWHDDAHDDGAADDDVQQRWLGLVESPVSGWILPPCREL